MYFPWNWEFGSALSKPRNVGTTLRYISTSLYVLTCFRLSEISNIIRSNLLYLVELSDEINVWNLLAQLPVSDAFLRRMVA
jgi:hypothetical protein